MNLGLTFWIVMGVAVVVTGGFLLAMRGSRLRAKAEFEADLKERQIDTLQGDIRRAEDIEKRADVARKTVVDGDLDLSERLRRSGRSRPTRTD